MANDYIISVGAQIAYTKIPYGEIQAEPADQAQFESYLGTPVWTPLEFLKTSGTSLDNSLGVGRSNGNSDTLLRIDTVLIVVNQTKNIIKTPIQGRNGTVKEYISMGDFEINIKGAIVSPYPLVYPKEDVSLFVELMNLPKPIPIASEFLRLFEIDVLVVENYSVAEKLGSRNEVPFEITAISDKADEVILTTTDA